MKPGQARPKVVMLVAGGIATDGRVRKSAQTVQSLGYDVTLLYSLRKISEPQRDKLGDVTTIGLPRSYAVARTRRKFEEETRRRRQQRFVRPAFPGYSSRVTYEWARQQNTLAGLKAAAYPKAVRAVLRLPRGVFRLREQYYLRREAVLAREPSVREPRRVDWEAEIPALSDLSLTFAREIWRREPDIIHAHDVHVLKAAVDAMHHLRAHGRRPRLIYDAHEFVAGSVRRTERLAKAWTAMETHYIRQVDAVITVSESIADALQSGCRLKDRPTVVLNAPVVQGAVKAPSDIRADSGLGPEVPLVAYSGSTLARRGVSTAVEALTYLPDVHLAIVCTPSVAHRYSQDLAEHARVNGVADRVHLLEPVEPEQVLDYLRTADLGVHPMLGGIPNHEMAMPNKLFDYIFAGLPVVVSDLQEMGAFVRRTGVGEPFAAGDAGDCARALTEVLASIQQYRSRLSQGRFADRYSWESQVDKVRAVYAPLRSAPSP